MHVSMGPRVADPDFSHGRPCFPHSETGHLLTAWPELSGAWAHRTQSKRQTDKVHRTRFQSQKVTNSKVALLLKLEKDAAKTSERKIFNKLGSDVIHENTTY